MDNSAPNRSLKSKELVVEELDYTDNPDTFYNNQETNIDKNENGSFNNYLYSQQNKNRSQQNQEKQKFFKPQLQEQKESRGQSFQQIGSQNLSQNLGNQGSKNKLQNSQNFISNYQLDVNQQDLMEDNEIFSINQDDNCNDYNICLNERKMSRSQNIYTNNEQESQQVKFNNFLTPKNLKSAQRKSDFAINNLEKTKNSNSTNNLITLNNNNNNQNQNQSINYLQKQSQIQNQLNYNPSNQFIQGYQGNQQLYPSSQFKHERKSYGISNGNDELNISFNSNLSSNLTSLSQIQYQNQTLETHSQNYISKIYQNQNINDFISKDNSYIDILQNEHQNISNYNNAKNLNNVKNQNLTTNNSSFQRGSPQRRSKSYIISQTQYKNRNFNLRNVSSNNNSFMNSHISNNRTHKLGKTNLSREQIRKLKSQSEISGLEFKIRIINKFVNELYKTENEFYQSILKKYEQQKIYVKELYAKFDELRYLRYYKERAQNLSEVVQKQQEVINQYRNMLNEQDNQNLNSLDQIEKISQQFQGIDFQLNFNFNQDEEINKMKEQLSRNFNYQNFLFQIEEQINTLHGQLQNSQSNNKTKISINNSHINNNNNNNLIGVNNQLNNNNNNITVNNSYNGIHKQQNVNIFHSQNLGLNNQLQIPNQTGGRSQNYLHPFRNQNQVQIQQQQQQQQQQIKSNNLNYYNQNWTPRNIYLEKKHTPRKTASFAKLDIIDTSNYSGQQNSFQQNLNQSNLRTSQYSQKSGWNFNLNLNLNSNFYQEIKRKLKWISDYVTSMQLKNIQCNLKLEQQKAWNKNLKNNLVRNQSELVNLRGQKQLRQIGGFNLFSQQQQQQQNLQSNQQQQNQLQQQMQQFQDLQKVINTQNYIIFNFINGQKSIQSRVLIQQIIEQQPPTIKKHFYKDLGEFKNLLKKNKLIFQVQNAKSNSSIQNEQELEGNQNFQNSEKKEKSQNQIQNQNQELEDQDGGQLHSDDLYLSPKENRSFMKKICGHKQDSQQENQNQNQNQIQVQNQNQQLQNQQYLNHQFEIPYENFSLGLISNNNNKRKESYFTNFTGMEERLITNQSEFNELNYFNQNLGGITNQNNLSQINNNNLNNHNINVNLNQISGAPQLQSLQFQQNQQLKFEKEVQTEMCQEDLELEGQNLEFKKKYYCQKKDFKERNFKLESKIQHQVDQIKFLINFSKSCGNCKDKLKIYYKQSVTNK